MEPLYGVEPDPGTWLWRSVEAALGPAAGKHLADLRWADSLCGPLYAAMELDLIRAGNFSRLRPRGGGYLNQWVLVLEGPNSPPIYFQYWTVDKHAHDILLGSGRSETLLGRTRRAVERDADDPSPVLFALLWFWNKGWRPILRRWAGRNAIRWFLSQRRAPRFTVRTEEGRMWDFIEGPPGRKGLGLVGVGWGEDPAFWVALGTHVLGTTSWLVGAATQTSSLWLREVEELGAAKRRIERRNAA